MATDLFDKVRGDAMLTRRRELSARDLLPYFRAMDGPPTAVTRIEGAERIMLGSSNYLGLSGDPRVSEGAHRATMRYGTSLNGSRFMNGTTPLHLAVEREVAQWLGTDDALIFPSGYATNVGCISALVGAQDTVVCDARDHASILDGATLARGRFLPFQHNRLDRLDTILRKAAGATMVVVDGVYSMQGDVSDLPAIVKVCQQRGARLLVDEAHAVGVLGPVGQGLSALAGVGGQVDLRMGTFSKALAGGGGFVAGPTDVIEYLRMHARAFMFTAATPPASVGAAQAALDIVRSAEGDERRARLAGNTERLRTGLAALGFDVAPAPQLADGTPVQTPILPVLIGDDVTTMLMWRALYEAGVYVNVALYPAVPQGHAQLRVSLMATHQDSHLDRALDAFAQARAQLPDGAGQLIGEQPATDGHVDHTAEPVLVNAP